MNTKCCKKNACRLVIRDDLLARLDVPVGRLAIRDDMAEFVSCSAAAVSAAVLQVSLRLSLYCCRDRVLYPVYTIEQTSNWLVQLTYSQLVEPA